MRNNPAITLRPLKSFLILSVFSLVLPCWWTGCKPDSEKSSQKSPGPKAGSVINSIYPASHQYFHTNPTGKFALPSGKMLDVKTALTLEEQTQGLSKLRPHEFRDYDS